jgi:1-acyl-sn-glycerol-3-phosphate acyltransferase
MANRIKSIITGILATFVVISTLLLINVTQMLSMFLIRPFSLQAFRNYNSLCAKFIWGWCVFAVEKVQGVEVIVSGDELPPHENAILLANHVELSDVLFVLSLAQRKGRLRDLKWFGKDALKYVPAVGWGLQFIDCVFLKRDWAKDQSSIEATFEHLRKYKVPMWLVNFMEGTRSNPKKLEASRAYALKTGLKPLKHLLLPRPKGFIASIKGLQGHLHAVYDVTFGYEGHPLTLLDLVLGRIRPVHIHVRRFALHDLPSGDTELTQWVRKLFEEKDQMLSDFIRTSHFPGEKPSNAMSSQDPSVLRMTEVHPETI